MKTLLFIAVNLIMLQNAVAQSASPVNIPSKTTIRQPIAEGANVWGVFHGRVPCQTMAPVMHISVETNCEKLKWGFTFFQDPQSKKPTNYEWDGSLFRDKPRTGKWALIRGTADDPEATVIQLNVFGLIFYRAVNLFQRCSCFTKFGICYYIKPVDPA